MGFGGSSGGSSSVAGSSDVALSSPADNQVLTYDGGTAKWTNADAPAATNALAYSTSTTRPSASGPVVFITDTDPGSNAQAGDLWISA